MKIKVTQEHIDKALEAKRRSSAWDRRAYECPLARALTAAMPYTSKPWGVGANSAYVAGFPSASFELPDKAYEFRKAFDADRPVKPFTFEI